MFNIIERAKRRIKKLCEYHNRKADKYERLAKHYAEKARQHRTASNAFMSGATTMELETLDVSDCDWSPWIDKDLIVINENLAQRIKDATARNDAAADKAIARTGDVKMSDAFAVGRIVIDPRIPAFRKVDFARAYHDLEKRNARRT